jgi:hypothetical protein
MRKFPIAVAAAATLMFATSFAVAELGSNNPPDDKLLMQREQEAGCNISTTPPTCPSAGSGIFDVAVPPAGTMFTPVRRVPRTKFGVVGPFPLRLQDLDALVFPDATAAERHAVLEGLTFFTTVHKPGENGAPNENGVGPINNQPFCLGCHENAAEAVRSRGLLGPLCPHGSACLSNVTRAARSTPTNFEFTSLNPATGGGVAPDNLDAVNNTGKTAAFTTFGDFSAKLLDTAPGSVGLFDPLDGAMHSSTTSSFASQPFGGLVQHHRPAVSECLPKPLPPVAFDSNLGASNPNKFRRSVGERAGPPYIGRGLMEAVPTEDITTNANPAVENGHSSLGNFASLLGCSRAGCISGAANMIPHSFTVHSQTTDPQDGTVTGFVGGVGRFGLRANGVEILQFVVGGLQGELSFTSLFNGAEIDFPTLFPGATKEATEPSQCAIALSETFGQPASVLPPPLTPEPVDLAKLEVHLSTPFSIRDVLRNTAPPEFGDPLLRVLRAVYGWSSRHAGDRETEVAWSPGSEEATVQRGAELFGIDLVAFANRTIGGAMAAGGDGRDDNAINQADRKLNCVGCHTPIQKTGQSPANVGAEHLSFVWAPLFSDLLLHHMPVVDAERDLRTKKGLQPLPRDPLIIVRPAAPAVGADSNSPKRGELHWVDTFDLPRNLADDTFSNLKASAEGSQFRTPPLMGLGRIGPPFLHDGRVYLSDATVNTRPAGTVTTNRKETNAPLAVRSLGDAILAAIELHDLPAPDDKNTPSIAGAGCPVPPKGSDTNIDYGPSPESVICPPYNTPTSSKNRSEAAEVMYRFHQLSLDDQQAVIEFLEQL